MIVEKLQIKSTTIVDFGLLLELKTLKENNHINKKAILKHLNDNLIVSVILTWNAE